VVIQDRNEELAAFCSEHFGGAPKKPEAHSNGHHAGLTDEEVLSLIRGAKNAAKFEALWAGDTTGYASPSEADQTLISLLAFYTQDEGQLDSLYRRSPLCREKWIKRPAYRRST
jgi:putative DNA primase/helicase